MRLKHNAARANSATVLETFNNWLATRHLTQQPGQDAELICQACGAAAGQVKPAG